MNIAGIFWGLWLLPKGVNVENWKKRASGTA